MEAPGSPREASPAPVALLAVPSNIPSRKRKRETTGNSAGATASPALSERGDTPNPSENVVLHKQDLLSRPRLTISRHPSFVPIAPGSPYNNTEPLCHNRLNFRYTPAGVTGIEGGIPFRTIESSPTAFRVSWEDRSPFIKVSQDGLGLRGDKGFRSARCNAPVREGKWYMEVTIGMGGGDKPEGSKRLEGSHVRVGFARREAPLNGPAGLDGYSYGMRDKNGEKIHLSRPRPYGEPFKSGDVIGMYISLPSPRRAPSKKDANDPAHIKRERIAIEYKGQEYFESLEYPQSKEMIALMDASDRKKSASSTPAPPATKKSATVKNLPSNARGSKARPPEPAPLRTLPTLGPESCIAFFVNGKSQGIAFRDLFDYLPLRTPASKHQEKRRANREGIREHRENPFDDGSLGYYPMLSLFNEAEVRLNPGPDFAFPPPPDIDALLLGGEPTDVKPAHANPTWRPMCERYAEYMEEQFALDRLEEEELRAGGSAPRAPAPKRPRTTTASTTNDPATPKTEDQPELESDAAKAEAEAKKLAKKEAHRAKRRAQAAARKERKRREQEAAAAALQEAAGSRAASVEAAPAIGVFTLEDAEMGEGEAERPYSPLAGSVEDVRAYYTGDASGYNTEYDDADGASSVGGTIDEELAALA